MAEVGRVDQQQRWPGPFGLVGEQLQGGLEVVVTTVLVRSSRLT
jgi:hypothetical protein